MSKKEETPLSVSRNVKSIFMARIKIASKPVKHSLISSIWYNPKEDYVFDLNLSFLLCTLPLYFLRSESIKKSNNKY